MRFAVLRERRNVVGWLFSKKNTYDECRHDMLRLVDQVALLEDAVAAGREEVATSRQQVAELEKQVSKLARLQYKVGQDTQAKFEEIAMVLSAAPQWEAEYQRQARENDLLQERQQHLVAIMMQQVDEIDAVCAGLPADADTEWRGLMEQWSQRLLSGLQGVGIHEIAIIGQSFDPLTAEGIGVVIRTAADQGVPYEVAAVTRRGFSDGDGNVLRKAQVITYSAAGDGQHE